MYIQGEPVPTGSAKIDQVHIEASIEAPITVKGKTYGLGI
jgi:hypothetical protein